MASKRVPPMKTWCSASSTWVSDLGFRLLRIRFGSVVHNGASRHDHGHLRPPRNRRLHMRQIVRAVLVALALALPAPTVALFAPPAQAEAALLDINSATKAQLDALPGIGAARSEAIIRGRPYNGKDDLVNRNIIPQSVYDGIKDRIIARQGSPKKK
jgi:hypothetical protein